MRKLTSADDVRLLKLEHPLNDQSFKDVKTATIPPLYNVDKRGLVLWR